MLIACGAGSVTFAKEDLHFEPSHLHIEPSSILIENNQAKTQVVENKPNIEHR